MVDVFQLLGSLPPPFLIGTTTDFAVHLLDPSRRRHRRPHTITRDPGVTQLRRWSLDPQDLCRLQPDRRVTDRLGSATESIRSDFERRRPGKAKHPRLTRFGLETGLPLLCRCCLSPGSFSETLPCFLKRTVSAMTLRTLPLR